MKLAQWRSQNRAHAQPVATDKVNFRIVLSVMAEDDLTTPHALRGNAGIGLQTDAQIGCGTPRACPADYFISPAQTDCRAAGPGQHLRTFRDYADCRLKADSRRILKRNHLLRCMRVFSPWSMCQFQFGFDFSRWHRPQQIADETVQLVVFNDARHRMAPQRSAE